MRLHQSLASHHSAGRSHIIFPDSWTRSTALSLLRASMAAG